MLTDTRRRVAALLVKHGATVNRATRIGGAIVLMGAVFYQFTGWWSLLVMGAVAAGVIGLWVGARKWPQGTGALLSTAAWATVLAGLATTFGALFAYLHADVWVSYLIGLIVVLAVTYIVRSPGVHRGWTTAVGQGTLMATLPIGLVWPGTSGAAVMFAVGMIGSVGLVLWRDRHKTAHRARTQVRWRRIAAVGTKTVAVSLVGLTMAGAIGLSSPSQAEAGPLSWLGGVVGGVAHGVMGDVICGITGPDLTPQPPGTGPETFFSNRNFGKVQDAAGGDPPPMADSADRFTRAATATNHSMDSYTLYEIAGLRGVKWVNWQHDGDGERDCAMMPWLSVLVGNQIMQINNYMLQATIAFKEYANGNNVADDLKKSLTPVVGSMYSRLFVPFAAVVMVAAGIAMLIRGLSAGAGRRAMSDAGGSAAVLLFGGVMFAGVTAADVTTDNSGFGIITGFGDRMGGMFNAAFAEAVLGSLDDGSPGDDERTMMCKSPASGTDEEVGAFGQRYTSCILAETLAYQPWAVGQFGQAGTKAIPATMPAQRFDNPMESGGSIRPEGAGDLPCYINYDDCADMRSYLIAHTGGPNYQIAQSQCVDEDDDYDVLADCIPFYAAADQLYTIAESDEPIRGTISAEEAAAATTAFHGYGTMPHILKATSTLIGSLFATLGIAAMSLVTLWWRVMLVIAFLLGPMRLAWAAWPGKMKMAQNWVSDVIYALLMSAFYGALTTLVVFLLALIYTADISAGFKLLWSILMIIGMWKAMRKMEEVAKPEGASNIQVAGKAQGALIGGAGAATWMAMRGGRGAGRRLGGGRGGYGDDTTGGQRSRRPKPDGPTDGSGGGAADGPSTRTGRAASAVAGTTPMLHATGGARTAAQGARNMGGAAKHWAATTRPVAYTRTASQATAAKLGGRFVGNERLEQWGNESKRHGFNFSKLTDKAQANNTKRAERRAEVRANHEKQRRALVWRQSQDNRQREADRGREPSRADRAEG